MAELAGTWTYRSFNPTYKTGNQTPQEERELIRGGRLDLTLKKLAPDPGHSGDDWVARAAARRPRSERDDPIAQP